MVRVASGAPPGLGSGLGAGGVRNLLSSAVSLLRPFLDGGVAALLPGECRLCGGVLVHASAVPVCAACRIVEPQDGALCRVCGEDLGMESARFAEGFGPAEGLVCTPCRMAPPAFERAVAHAVYDGGLREMIHLLKYEAVKPLGRVLGPMLAESMLELRGRAAPELVVTAVPLFGAKEHQRGYNQAEVLTRAALQEVGRRAPEWRLRYDRGVLMRPRETRSQFELSARGRRRNLIGAFAVRAGGLGGAPCEVMLVDDIYTSGATARECARVLRRGGAAKVWVVTLARAQRPRVAMWDAVSIRQPVGFG